MLAAAALYSPSVGCSEEVRGSGYCPGHSLSTSPAGEMELPASAPPHRLLTQHNTALADVLMVPLNGEKRRAASGQAVVTAGSLDWFHT